MARINWNTIEREENAIQKSLDNGDITLAEYHKQINELAREAREDFQEQQRDEYRDECGGW